MTTCHCLNYLSVYFQTCAISSLGCKLKQVWFNIDNNNNNRGPLGLYLVIQMNSCEWKSVCALAQGSHFTSPKGRAMGSFAQGVRVGVRTHILAHTSWTLYHWTNDTPNWCTYNSIIGFIVIVGKMYEVTVKLRCK